MNGSKKIIAFSAALITLVMLVFYSACSHYESNRKYPVPESEPMLTPMASPSPSLKLFLDEAALLATVPPNLAPTPIPLTPTAVPKLIKELSKFDITVDEKKHPVFHYQFVGEGTAKPRVFER